MQKADNDITSIPESDVTSKSSVSVPDEVLEMCTGCDFDSDGTTISDVGKEDDNDFSQWTDEMDALVASFDVGTENAAASITGGLDADQMNNETIENTSTSESPVSTPRRNRAGMLSGSSASPLGAKRHLVATFDNFQEPPSSRQRQIIGEGVTDGQAELSPLRKTLSSTLTLRTS